MLRLASIVKRRKHVVLTVIFCLVVVRALVLSLQHEREEEKEEGITSRSSKQITLSTQEGHRYPNNKYNGMGNKPPDDFNSERGHRRKKHSGGKLGGPTNQHKTEENMEENDKGFKRRLNSAVYNERDSPTREEIEGVEEVAVTTDVAIAFTGDVIMDSSESNFSISYHLTEEVPLAEQETLQAGLVRVAFVENRYRGIHRYLQEPLDSGRCTCRSGRIRNDVTVTTENEVENLGDYDALIFVQDMGQKPLAPPSWKNILSSAKEGQRRVYASVQSVSTVRHLFPSIFKSNSPFHWSLTYHSKSDIHVPFGHYLPFDYGTETDNGNKNWAEGKTGLVAWMSFNKNTLWKIDDFVSSLQDYFQVDSFGTRFETCDADDDSCMENIKNYKFYLAIENSCCSEYITDKPWKSLSLGVVPIVIGAPKEDYLRVAPPNSFIYADDFKSPEDLGDYLRKLDNTDEFYNDYFLWRQNGKVTIDPLVQENSIEDVSTALYSCETVCQVATKYVSEVSVEKDTYNGTYFDPRTAWWGKSCQACGSQGWINKFNFS